MQTLGIFKQHMDTLCKKYASGKCQQRKQVTQYIHPFAHHQVRTHEYDVSGLCIGEYFISRKICIRILKSTGQCQKYTGNKCFGHLNVFLHLVVEFHKTHFPYNIFRGIHVLIHWPQTLFIIEWFLLKCNPSEHSSIFQKHFCNGQIFRCGNLNIGVISRNNANFMSRHVFHNHRIICDIRNNFFLFLLCFQLYICIAQ